jgi:hypothetical protein
MRDYRELGPELSPERDPELDTELDPELDTERGDVPGWVLVTLMTAGLVVALWAVAGPLLENAFRQAISSVTGQG